MTKAANLFTGAIVGSLLTALVFSTSLNKASAQDPVKLAPEHYKVLVDNRQLRVIDYRFKPGEREPVHSHPAGVLVYYLSDAKIRTTLADGKVTETSNKAGDTVWRDPVVHAGENIGSTEAHGLLIEPKSTCR